MKTDPCPRCGGHHRYALCAPASLDHPCYGYSEGIDLIIAFQPWMLLKLWQNRNKRGWQDCKMGYLTRRIYDEARELSRSVQSKDSPYTIACEAADVANFAAMCAHKAHLIGGQGG